MKNETAHGICKKCGAEAVHLAMAGQITFVGDQDDDFDEESIYADEPIVAEDVSVGVHICYECGHVEDAWIENPREDFKPETEPWFISHLRQDDETKGSFVGHTIIDVGSAINPADQRVDRVSYIELVPKRQGNARRAWLMKWREAVERTLSYIDHLQQQLNFWQNFRIASITKAELDGAAILVFRGVSIHELEAIYDQMADRFPEGLMVVSLPPDGSIETMGKAELKAMGYKKIREANHG